jgi:hypothetical protein
METVGDQRNGSGRLAIKEAILLRNNNCRRRPRNRVFTMLLYNIKPPLFVSIHTQHIESG